VNHVKRDPANFVAIFIPNQNSVVPVLQLRPFLKQQFGEDFGGIHCCDVVGQFRPAFVSDSFGINEVEVIEGHYFPSALLELGLGWAPFDP
jgi:hypothetical protein